MAVHRPNLPGRARTVAVGSSVTGASRDSAELVPPRAGFTAAPSASALAESAPSRTTWLSCRKRRHLSSPRLSIPPVQVDALPLAELLFRREENPSATSPLTYRETAWVVPEGTSVDAAVRLALGMFEGVRASLADVAPGKLVNLAVFDHRFEGRPRRAPLATLTWKDWKDKGQGPQRFAARATPR